VLHSAYYAPNGYLGLLTACVLVALGLGARAGWLALAASTAILVAIAALFATSNAAMTDAALLDVRSPGNWGRTIGVFLGMSGALLACVSYLTVRLERAMERSRALLAALAVESKQRVDALERQHELSSSCRRAGSSCRSRSRARSF
jgi:hypothetical protein